MPLPEQDQVGCPAVNVITRTSGRPEGFNVNVQSIRSQTYKNINHVICTDDLNSIKYVEEAGFEDCLFVQRDAVITNDPNPEDVFKTGPYSPHNLYLNHAIKLVQEGWIVYLDDDDSFMNEHSVQQVVDFINLHDEDTLVYWQMLREEEGDILPVAHPDPPMICTIGGSCMGFHTKYRDLAVWDSWKCADFRVIKRLHENIPKSAFLNERVIRCSGQGFGQKKDINL